MYLGVLSQRLHIRLEEIIRNYNEGGVFKGPYLNPGPHAREVKIG
jgi:hypothetical protein